MALTAAQMVTLIQEEIQARVTGVKRGGNDGENWEHYGLQELYDLKKQYQAEVDAEAASATGGLSMSTIVRTRLGADAMDDEDDG
jgi:hypothetical protein